MGSVVGEHGLSLHVAVGVFLDPLWNPGVSAALTGGSSVSAKEVLCGGILELDPREQELRNWGKSESLPREMFLSSHFLGCILNS